MDLNSEGSGIVEINQGNTKTLELDNVICVESLSENLFSLRRFAEMGLGISLDNEKIDSFDLISNESFITGLYKQPYWVIELEINSSNTNDSVTHECANRSIFADLIENETGEHTHFIRSRAKLAPNNEIENQEEPLNKEENVNDTGERTDFKEKLETRKAVKFKEKSLLQIKEIYNFDTTICDSQFHDVDELPFVISPDERFKVNHEALLRHVRFGHTSITYLKALQNKFPENTGLRKAISDEALLNCKVCIIAKMKSLPSNLVRTRATEPLQIIHSDLMGPMSPVTHPKIHLGICR